MRGLSLWQPWAQLVAIGAKRVETRSWLTVYTGPLAIHATRHMPAEAKQLMHTEPFASALADYVDERTGAAPPRGGIIAVAELERCVEITEDSAAVLRETNPNEYAFGDYEPGRIAWVLGDVRKLPSMISCDGARGLWKIADDVLERLEMAL